MKDMSEHAPRGQSCCCVFFQQDMCLSCFMLMWLEPSLLCLTVTFSPLAASLWKVRARLLAAGVSLLLAWWIFSIHQVFLQVPVSYPTSLYKIPPPWVSALNYYFVPAFQMFPFWSFAAQQLTEASFFIQINGTCLFLKPVSIRLSSVLLSVHGPDSPPITTSPE